MNKRHINNPERTKRGKHRYSSFFILSSSLLLLLLAACTNDPSEDILSNVPGNGDLPQGTFVIDYTASTGDTRTRLAASERIQSLDYLLYEKAAGSNNFILKHRRTIPDINGNTVWPLTRETMTWEQREALKDTLNQSSDYKMVFVANADAKIWDNTEVLQNVTEGSSTFDNGRLVLPPSLFTDNDMYYMWSNHDAPLVGSNYNKNNPASMEITLQRMINKVEVKLDEEVVNGINAAAGNSYAEKVDAYCAAKAKEYYEELITANYTTVSEAGKLYNSVKDCMEALANGLALDLGGHLPKYETALENVQSTIKGESFINSVNTDYLSVDNSSIRLSIEKDLKDLYRKYCYWNKEGKAYVQVVHNSTQQAYANSIGFDKKTYGSTESDTNLYEVENNAFTYYRFGNNEATEAILNQVQEFRFLNAENETDFSIVGTTFPINDYKGGNQHLVFECNPIGSQTPSKGEIAKEDATNLYSIEGFSIPERYGSWTDDTFGFDDWITSIDKFTSQLNSGSEFDSSYIGFNGDIENITLKIAAPVVTVSPTWEAINE